MKNKYFLFKFTILAFCLILIGSALQNKATVLATTDLGDSGPYSTTTKSYTGFTVFCPQTLDSGHPVITWGNGTGSPTLLYASLLRHLASYGFVVVCSDSVMTGTGTQLVAGIDLMENENKKSGGFFYNKLDLTKVGTCGHSQGGGGAIMAAKDSRVICSAPLMPMPVSTFGIKGSMFIVTGSLDIIILPTLVKIMVYGTFGNAAVYACLKGAMHTEPVLPASTFKKYLTGWFLYHLKNDSTYKSMFYGSSAKILKDSKWRVSVKGTY